MSAVEALEPTAMLHLSREELTYDEVGWTAQAPPAGFRHGRAERVIGRGADAFGRAVDSLLGWGMHAAAGMRVRASTPDVQLGSVVVLGLGLGPVRVQAPCRVVYVIDEPDRHGFAYGTLHGHPESGEEAFVVRTDRAGRVIASVVWFSRPAVFWARATGPVQRRVSQRYLDALARSAT
jgi:uncharacterized protein (UPF0548 family)